MARLGTISVGMELDATRFGSGLAKVSTEVRTFSGDVDRLGSTMKGLLVGGLAGYGASRVGGWLLDVSKTAARAEDSINALTVTFGDQASQIEGFARDMASAYNLGLNKVLNAQNQIGGVLQGAGFSPKDAAMMTEGLTRIALDTTRLRSGFTFEEIKGKFLSGLVGEQEPLKALGLGFNEEMIKAHAAKMGMGDGKADLTEQQKVLARYSYFVDRSAVAMGHAAKEAGGLAARIDGLSGAWEDFQLTVGEVVAPAMATLFDDMTTGLKLADSLWRRNKDSIFAWTTEMTAGLGVGTSGMGLLAESMGLVADAAYDMRGAFKVAQQGTTSFLGQAAGALAPYFGQGDATGTAPFGWVGDWLGNFAEEAGLQNEKITKEIGKLVADGRPSDWIASELRKIEADAEAKRKALASKPVETPPPILGDDAEKEAKKKAAKAAQPFAAAMLDGSKEAAETILRSKYGMAAAKESEQIARNTKATADALGRLPEAIGGVLGRAIAEAYDGKLDWS